MRRTTRRTRGAVSPVIRFEDATENVINMVDSVRATYYPDTNNARIRCLFDLRKRKHGGNLVLGRIQRANDLIRRLTVEERVNTEGANYILMLDKVAWECMTDVDRTRLIMHELNHIEVFPDKKNPWCLKDHDFSDFQEQVNRNQDDPGWARRIATVVEDIYSQEGENNQENNG